MGKLDLQCITLAGSRFIGLAYTCPTASYPEHSTHDDFTHVVLIQSNPNPQNLTNLSWSLISAWPRTANIRSDLYSSLACHVNPLTGVFTLMSNFSGNLFDDRYNYGQKWDLESVPLRPPGGFQYIPPSRGGRPEMWADIGLNSNYGWGNVSATFDLFTWPGSLQLYHARIGNTVNGTINLSMLFPSPETMPDGPSKFVNVANYTLNPDVHGFPMKVAYANNSIYQLGRLITDKRTGEFGYFLTRIPLDTTATDASGFKLPADLVAYDASAVQSCQMETTKIWYSSPQATLYVLCSVPSSPGPPDFSRPRLLVTWIKNGDKALNKPSNITTNNGRPLIQPIDRNDSSGAGVWTYLNGYYRSQSDVLIDPVSGGLKERPPQGQSLDPVTIPEPYGYDQDANTFSPTSFVEENLALIIAGAVIGFLLILAAICFIPFRRRWRRSWRAKWGTFKTQTWPRWVRKVRLKLIDLLKEKEDTGGGDRDAEDKVLQGKRDVSKDSEDGFNSNKFEEHSMNSLDGLEGCDKILVTDDMDLSGLGSPLAMMDVATGYMNGVRLEAHPRPGVVTSLANSKRISSSNGGSSSSFEADDSPSPPEYLNLVTPSAPALYTSSEDIVNISQASPPSRSPHESPNTIPPL
ncbi:hypothetical protein BKA57DRAFT_118159 [Linnemannia elongata]|nr:hypothetical protein BKA57DRAFT_118159 [Linnemannia elongata]